MTVKKLQQALDKLACELQRAGLWDSAPPNPEQLMSKEPFCVDTLRFEQWLQWVFIPKLGEMVNMPNFSGLPNQSDVHTMAEYAFQEYSQDTKDIRSVIKQIDDDLNQFTSPSIH